MKMKFKKNVFKTIEEMVVSNTGMTLEELLNDSDREPYIKDLDRAVELTRSYMEAHPEKPIYIIGDYDCDGITSSSIMYWTFAKLRRNPIVRIPLRFTEGYGLSEKIIAEIPEESFVITVDNGIAAIRPIQLAKDKGMTVVVTDHHLPVMEDGKIVLPPADVVVDPHLGGSEFEDYCGAGIAYRFALAITGSKCVPALLALAGVGTVADVMPLVGANRTLVKKTLRVLNSHSNVPGMNALLGELEIERINETGIGFHIAPVINASGRLNDDGAMDAFRLFTETENTREAARELILLNSSRKKLTREALDLVKDTLDGQKPIVVYDEKIGEGIIGLVSGKLSEKYRCPVITFTKIKNGEGEEILKGSGRSVPGINLKEALDRISDLILGYGGHAGAAGLSIRKENLDAFRKAFREACGEMPENVDEIIYDFDIPARAIPKFVEKQQKFAPYGEGNPRPIVHLVHNAVGDWKRIGDGSHFMLRDPRITFMGFGLADEYEAMGAPRHLDVVGYVSQDWYKGKPSYKFEIISFRKEEEG